MNEAVLRAHVTKYPYASTREMSSALGTSKNTINRHLHQLNFSNKTPRLHPHDLTAAQAQNRVDICKQLLENPCDDRFWRRIITGDEKWIIFLRNPDKRRQWVPEGKKAKPVVRQVRFCQKVMLSVWWNFEGVVHFELIKDGRAVNGDLYSQQLDRVYEVLKCRYPGLINRKLLQHDNAPAHRARLTQDKIRDVERDRSFASPSL